MLSSNKLTKTLAGTHHNSLGGNLENKENGNEGNGLDKTRAEEDKTQKNI